MIVYRLFLVRAALVQDGRGNEFVPLDTGSLPIPAYHHYLHKQFQQRWMDFVPLSYTNSVRAVGLIQLLAVLSRTNDLYYLHPSFGYYFEQFYLEPHGLVYKLKTLPMDTFLPPPLDENQITENENFWTHDAAPSVAKGQPSLLQLGRALNSVRANIFCCGFTFRARQTKTPLFLPAAIIPAALIFGESNCSVQANSNALRQILMKRLKSIRPIPLPRSTSPSIRSFNPARR